MHPILHTFQIYGLENHSLLKDLTELYDVLQREVGPIVLETSIKNTGVNIFNISMVPRSYNTVGIHIEKNKEIVLDFIRKYASPEIYSILYGFYSIYSGNIGFGIQKGDRDDSYQFNLYTTQPVSSTKIEDFFSLFPNFSGQNIDTPSPHNMLGICFNKSSIVSLKVYALGMEVKYFGSSVTGSDPNKYKLLFDTFGKFTSNCGFVKRYQVSGDVGDKCYLNFMNKHLYVLTEVFQFQLNKYFDFSILLLSYLLGKEITYIASSGKKNLELYFRLN